MEYEVLLCVRERVVKAHVFVFIGTALRFLLIFEFVEFVSLAGVSAPFIKLAAPVVGVLFSCQTVAIPSLSSRTSAAGPIF